jgi:vitamin B12 transporter
LPGDNGDPSGYEDDSFYRLGGTARIEAFNDFAKVYLAGSWTKARSEFENVYAFTPPYTIDPNDPLAYQTYDSWRLAGGGEMTMSKDFAIISDVAYTRTERHFPEETFYTRAFTGDDIYGSLQANATFAQHANATLGVDGLWQHATIKDAADTITIDRGARLIGTWLSLGYDLPWISVQAIGRHDDHSREGGANTWRLSAATFWFEQQYKVFASAGSGFRAPTLYELYDPGAGNEALKPQTSLSADLGHAIRLADSGISLTNIGFLTKYDEAITFQPVFPYQSVNIPSDARVYGLENALRYDSNVCSTGISYTWQDSDNGSGSRLNQLPDHKLMIDGTVRQWDAWLHVAVERIWSRDIGQQTLPAYTVINAALGYALSKHWDIYARMENLADEGYEIYPTSSTPRRALYGGVRASF